MDNQKSPYSSVDEIKADIMDIYKKDIMDRIDILSEEEKKILQDFSATPAAQVISKILGPELSGMGAAVPQEQDQMQEPPKQVSLPLDDQMNRAGLGAR